MSIEQIVAISSNLRAEDKLPAITTLMKKNTWQPLTLTESGMFHIAFGAIVGVAAYSRGRVQEAQIKSGYMGNENVAAPLPAGSQSTNVMQPVPAMPSMPNMPAPDNPDAPNN